MAVDKKRKTRTDEKPIDEGLIDELLADLQEARGCHWREWLA
jgi:hypothetical protein